MKTICKPRIFFDRHGDRLWHVQLWYSFDAGKTFVFSDVERVFDCEAEAYAYFNSHRTPLRVFPLVTPERQKDYERHAEAKHAESKDEVPCICGYYGRACYQMGKDEGANRMNCTSCKLAEFCSVVEMEEYAKS